MLQPLRRLRLELKILATVMQAVMPLMAGLLLQPLMVFAMPTILEPIHSLHCQRSRAPQHDHCRFTRVHALAFSHETRSFPLAALERAQLRTASGMDDVTLEQLLLVLNTPATHGASAQQNGPTLVMSPLDVRHKEELVRRIQRFRHDNEQDRLDLLILPLDFWTVVAMILAIPGLSLLLWVTVRFQPPPIRGP